MMRKRTIHIHSDKYGDLTVFVSDVDFEKCCKHHWSIKKDGCRFYAHTSVNGNGLKTSMTMHRFILGDELTDDKVVDHIDGDGLNNQRSNLRIVTRAENARNRKLISTNTTGHAGVSRSYDKDRDTYYWQSSIVYDKKPYVNRFYESKHGYEKARELAITKRKELEKKFNYIVRYNENVQRPSKG